jgi:2-dehydro-3-deoxyphosphogluconate aldolase/(4S)-4-hydroxy-2-oxoglutarate aldolase
MGASVLARIAATGIVPVVRIERAEDAPELARTLAGAGLPCIEITFRSAAAVDAIRAIRAQVPEVLVGAGTVVSLDQLERALAAGASFIVSPGLQPDVVRASLARDIPILPGVYTPTEIILAMDLGLSAVKLFPAASAGGPAYLHALAGPFPAMRFVPTGGIDLADLEGYLRLPSVLAVGGSWMVRPELLAARDWPAVGRLAGEAVAVVRTLRGSPASG